MLRSTSEKFLWPFPHGHLMTTAAPAIMFSLGSVSQDFREETIRMAGICSTMSADWEDLKDWKGLKWLRSIFWRFILLVPWLTYLKDLPPNITKASHNVASGFWERHQRRGPRRNHLDGQHWRATALRVRTGGITWKTRTSAF